MLRQLWNDELNLSKTIDRLEVKIQQVNNCSLRLHLIPADSKNARGVSYKMVLDKSMVRHANVTAPYPVSPGRHVACRFVSLPGLRSSRPMPIPFSLSIRAAS